MVWVPFGIGFIQLSLSDVFSLNLHPKYPFELYEKSVPNDCEASYDAEGNLQFSKTKVSVLIGSDIAANPLGDNFGEVAFDATASATSTLI